MIDKTYFLFFYEEVGINTSRKKNNSVVVCAKKVCDIIIFFKKRRKDFYELRIFLYYTSILSRRTSNDIRKSVYFVI